MNLFFLALVSALLFAAGFYPPLNMLVLIAWVPLLIIEDKVSGSNNKRKKLTIIGLSYLTFFIWNLLTTWWIYYASFSGACMAFISNAIFMCTAFMVWYNLKQRINKPWAIWLLIPFWLAYEYGHTLWDLTWSWLILGNAFAFSSNLIQWYEITGTSGGSLWVLVVSISIFQFIKKGDYTFKSSLKPILYIALPILISFLVLGYRQNITKNNQTQTYQTLIVQPNVDPYNDKFFYEPNIQLHLLLEQIKNKIDSTTDFLVLPETYLTEDIFEGKENSCYSIPFLRDSILKYYPQLTIICGASTVRTFAPNETPSSTARTFSDGNGYYDQFNTGMQLNIEGVAWYHKSKLVPGVERMPFPALFKPLESYALDLGGTIGSLGMQTERTVFYSHDHKVGIAPVICYESVYPDYVREYVKNGANFIFILTNDGWWENTPGHRQHVVYAKLRAIETRREIARSANTGISCFITPLGEIEQATAYWEKAVISKSMTPHNNLTFFVRFGDLISYLFSGIAVLLFIWSQLLRFKILNN